MEASPSYDLLGLFAARVIPGFIQGMHQPDVSGIWSCDDGGRYFVRQIGTDVLWFGEGRVGEREFANVAHGHLDGHGRLRLMWADVPKGAGGACGALVLDVSRVGEMQAARVTGGFGGRVWTR